MSKAWLGVILLLCILSFARSQSDDDDDFVYTRGPIPNTFSLGQRYPDRDEDVECQPIRLRADRDSKTFHELVTFTGNQNVHFKSSDSRIMSLRLHSKVTKLVSLYYNQYRVKLYVLKAWTGYNDPEVRDRSLHYEGRSIKIHVTAFNVTKLLKLAVSSDIGFDWVQYHIDGYASLSVIPDICDINVDMVFVSDQSGSVGAYNNRIALNFISDVIDFFTIGENMTQVGLVTYSTNARVRFDLDDIHSKSEIQATIRNIGFPGGWTATALGLFQAGVFLNPTEQRGGRPTSLGIPKIVVLLTDGKSNTLPINDVATSLHAAGVQVFTVGIGNIFLPELRFIASDPDRLHVFLLDSFNDASGFVDFLSFSVCKAPAIVEPGENTTTEVPEDGFRFFQTECTAFSPSVIIEQIDIYGKCSLYASDIVQNPGPLDDYALVARNEDKTTDRRSLLLKLKALKKIIYISVRGLFVKNTFAVIIWDRLFTKEHFMVYAFEDRVNAEIFDLDQELTVLTEKFSYRIKEGNEGEEFVIDPITGILTVVKPLFINVQPTFELIIVAENVNASCHRGRVKVTVNVVNNPLEFTNIQPASIPEDIQNNTLVTQVEAQGGEGVVQYFIESGNIGDAFEIDEDNGEVTVANSLSIDFETTPQYSLVIRAVSTPSLVSITGVLVIDVTDINEQPFFVTLCAQQGTCVFDALENQTEPITIGIILAEDPDLPTTNNGMLTYTISPTGMPFTIDNTGTLMALTLDRELVDEHQFTVTVSDGGNPSLSISTNVIIQVIDVNDNRPVFVQGLSAFALPENFPLSNLTQYIAQDDDLASTVTYSLQTNQDELPFIIFSSNGILQLNTPLDFDLGPRVYLFDVVATDPGGLSTVFPVVVEITDVNDNTPQFSQILYEASVIENSPAGTFVVTTDATDLDSNLNGLVEYMILSGNFNSLFSINKTTGVIRTNAVLDREQIVAPLILMVEARDMGTPSLVNMTTVTITVLDENDNAPMFVGNTQLTLPEDLPLGVVKTLLAIDNDQPNTPNSEVSYSISSGNEEGVFELNTTTGDLSLVSPLDFETTTSYVLVIVASDAGTPIMSDSVSILVNVTNVNDNPPVVSGSQDISVREDEPVGFVIIQFTASDLDQNDLFFSFGQDSNNDGIFAINSTGFVSLEQMLDFETAERHELEVVVTDGLSTDTATLRVNVIDFNEFAPVFDIGNTAFEVLEEQPIGTPVGTVLATDQDTAQTITYSFEQQSSLFTIDPSSGLIETSAVLDRETLHDNGILSVNSTIEVVVIATDNGLIPGSLFTTQTFVITVVDINDNSPVFDRSSYEASVNENMIPPVSLIAVIATDADIGTNGEINFSLSGQGSSSFAIDSTTGLVTVVEVLDRENINSYDLTITATDNGASPLSSNVTLNVIVDDVNDNPPLFASPITTVLLLENEPVNVPVFLVRATDLDDGINAEITYRIEDSERCQQPMTPPLPDTCLFTINPNSATVQLNQNLDFETQEEHTFVIIATDRGIPSLSSNTTVIVSVGNVDEAPPVFSESCVDTEIPEDIALGSFVVSCNATDFDEVTRTQNDNVVYLISSNSFSIDNDGDVLTGAVFDREDVDSFEVTIGARDVNGNIATRQITVTITDVNDNHLSFIGDPYFVDVTLQTLASYQQDLITITASDPDLGPNGEITFTITNIVINSAQDQAILSIVATDNGTPQLTNSTLVTVNFVDEPCAIQSYSITSLNTMSATISGRFLCAVSISPTDLMVQVGGGFALLCTVLRNLDATVEYTSSAIEFTPFLDTLERADAGLPLILGNVTTDNDGTYNCMATTDIGIIATQEGSIVQVLEPVNILSGPGEVVAEVGLQVQLTCEADNTEGITWAWGSEGSTPPGNNDRIFPLGSSLLFLTVEEQDSGSYTCEVSNAVDRDQETGTLIVFDPTDVVQVTITNISDPDINNNCNSFNTTDFKDQVTGAVGQTSLSINVTGDSLCKSDPCHPDPCKNGALCQVTGNTYTCDCIAGFTGMNCSEDIDECSNGTACLNNGICTNTHGAFSCQCPDGVFGDACEYVHSDCTCPPTSECVEVEGSPSECVNFGSSSSLLVQDPVPQNTAILDQVINNLNEDQPSNSGRRRRETFVTICTGKFVRSASNPNNLLLVWICPDGVESPSEQDLERFCRFLLSRQLVRSCTLPNGDIATVPTVNASTASVSFIILDSSSGRPLPASEAIVVLENTGALQKLKANGINAVEFKPLVPSTVSKSSSSSSQVGGAVGGILLAIIVITAVTVATIVLLKLFRKRKPKTIVNDNIDINVKLDVITNTNAQDLEEEPRYSRVNKGGRMTPLATDGTTYVVTSSLGSPTSLKNPYSAFFDDPIYTSVAKPKRMSTIKGGDSTENLLEDAVEDSGEYDMPDPPVRTTSLHEHDPPVDEPIYGNMGFQFQEQNIGARWESYQKTRTILQGSRLIKH